MIMNTLLEKSCLMCKKILLNRDNETIYDFKVRKFCNRVCYFKHNTGDNHYYWRGGIKRRPDGYLRDSKTDKYIHRMVMEAYLGRELKAEEHIHHIDGDPSNNDIKNLAMLSNSEHRKLENKTAKRNKYGRYTK